MQMETALVGRGQKPPQHDLSQCFTPTCLLKQTCDIALPIVRQRSNPLQSLFTQAGPVVLDRRSSSSVCFQGAGIGLWFLDGFA